MSDKCGFFILWCCLLAVAAVCQAEGVDSGLEASERVSGRSPVLESTSGRFPLRVDRGAVSETPSTVEEGYRPLRMPPSERRLAAQAITDLPAGLDEQSFAESATPLPPRSQRGSEQGEVAESASSGRVLSTVLGSLGLVLATFFLVVWLAKRNAPRGNAPLPAEVVESLGRVSLAGKQQLQLLRVGSKLVLVNVTPQGAETLTEITDPEEVDRLSAICQQHRPDSISATFRQVLAQATSDRDLVDRVESRMARGTAGAVARRTSG